MSKEPSLFPDLPLPDPALQPTPRAERAPRLLVPQRNQIELRPVDLEATLAPEHPARNVWAFVEGLDLSALYTDIGSVEGHAGRAAIDPGLARVSGNKKLFLSAVSSELVSYCNLLPVLLVPKLPLGNPGGKLQLPGIHPDVEMWKRIDQEPIGSTERPRLKFRP